MSKQLSRFVESVARVNEFVNEVFGPHIENIVKNSGNEELRPVLKDLFVKYLCLEHAIQNTKDVEGLEVQIEGAAQLLERRILEAHEKIRYLAEIKKAKLRRIRATFAEDFYSLSHDTITTLPEAGADDDEEDIESRRIVKDAIEAAKQTFKTMDGMFDGFEGFEDSLAYMDQLNLSAGLRKFRRWRKLRKFKQRFLRLLWNALIFGWVFGLIVSGATKLLAPGDIVVLAVVGLVVALVKEYLIGPRLSELRLVTQKRDLLLSVHEFMTADLNFTILAPIIERRRREKLEPSIQRMASEIEKEFSPSA
jgi:hypothetical protein